MWDPPKNGPILLAVYCRNIKTDPFCARTLILPTVSDPRIRTYSTTNTYSTYGTYSTTSTYRTYNTHTVFTVHTVHTVLTAHTIHTVLTVHTVHTVHTVYTTHTIHTILTAPFVFPGRQQFNPGKNHRFGTPPKMVPSY